MKTKIIIIQLILWLTAVSPVPTMAQEFCNVTTDDSLITISMPEGCRLEFTNCRPSTKDKSVLLCIPAAFTTPEGTIQGAYAINGHVHQSYNGHSKISIQGNTFSLGPTFTTDNGFQQMCLVRNGQPVHFRDNSRYVRRALCKRDSHSQAIIIESRHAITMNEFARLLSRRVHSAVYTDMGSFGFGWYRSSLSPTYLSPLAFYKQRKQTNWLVWRRPSE